MKRAFFNHPSALLILFPALTAHRQRDTIRLRFISIVIHSLLCNMMYFQEKAMVTPIIPGMGNKHSGNLVDGENLKNRIGK